MKLKKKFDLIPILEGYKKARNIPAKKEADIDAAFKAGAAAMFKLAVYDVQDLAKKSERKACKALSILEDQVGKFAKDQLREVSDAALDNLLENLFGGDGWLKTDDFAARRDSFDIRDEYVEEKHRESMEELRKKAAEAKAQGREFTVGINDRNFDDVEDAIAYATENFQDQLKKKRELLKEFEEADKKIKVADETSKNLGDILKSEKASIADDEQK